MLFHFLLLFEVDWRQHSISSVLTLRIVEHLDVVEYILPCLLSCAVGTPAYSFTFEQLEEAFGNSVIVTIATPAH